MPDETDYEKLTRLIEDIEASAQKSETSVASISDSVLNAQPSTSMGYEKLVGMIEEVESGRRPREVAQPQAPRPQQAPVQAPAPQPSAPQPHIVTGLEQAKYAQVPVQKPEVPKPQPQKFQVPTEAVQKQKERVAKELGQIAGKLGSIKPPQIEFKKKINIKELVLPNLSLADQISELERIIEGLNEHVFDADHMDIVRQEVYGLQQYVTDSKKQLKAQKGVLSPLEQSLWDVRDQRISDAIGLIRGYGAS